MTHDQASGRRNAGVDHPGSSWPSRSPSASAPQGAFAQDEPLTLNDKQYFEKRGLDVLVFTNEYNGMFFDEKTAGIELIHHGVRTATGGAVRLSPTPEQWDQIPKVVDRKVDPKTNTIEVTLRYEAFDFDSRLVVTPDGAGFKIAVYLDKPVPADLEGRAGLNLEFLPSRYWEHTYLVDGRPGIFPRYPAGPTTSLPPEKKIRQFEGHSTFDLHGHEDYVEALPVAAGKTLLMAPEDAERSVTIRSLSGELQLLDGRNLAQNGWYVVRTLLATKATGKVAEWSVEPHTIPSWTRTPVIGFSQVGYHPSQPKRAVIELDANDTPLADGLAGRDPAGRHAGREDEGEGPAVGQVPPLQLRAWPTSRRSRTRASTSSSTGRRRPARSRSPATCTSGSGTRRSTCSSRSRWTTCS